MMDAKVERGTALTRQNLEPNRVSVKSDGDGKISFSVTASSSDMAEAAGSAVETYNRFASLLGRKKIMKSAIMGLEPTSQELEEIQKQQGGDRAWEKSAEDRRSVTRKASAFCNRLRKYRRIRGKKITDVATALGMNRDDYLKVELGFSKPLSGTQLVTVSEALGLASSYFMKLKAAADRDSKGK